MIRIAIVILSSLLAGCIPSKVIITPNKLPDAVVGELYYIEIQIKGGTPVASLKWEALPINNGFFVKTIEKEGFGEKNFLKIYGIPVEAVNTKITLYGFTYGTSFSGKEFKKIYIIKVKEQTQTQ